MGRENSNDQYDAGNEKEKSDSHFTTSQYVYILRKSFVGYFVVIGLKDI